MSTGSRRLVGLGIVLSFWIPVRLSTSVVVDRLLINIIPILGACAVIVAAQGLGIRHRLSTRIPVWLGRISYSLYLVHVVVLHMVLSLRPPGAPHSTLRLRAVCCPSPWQR